jgi:hypothetical protein
MISEGFFEIQNFILQVVSNSQSTVLLRLLMAQVVVVNIILIDLDTLLTAIIITLLIRISM